jgi:hypothetical protein
MSIKEFPILKSFVGKPILDKVINSGYQSFYDAVHSASKSQKSEFELFIGAIKEDFSDIKFDFYLRKNGCLAIGQRMPHEETNGKRFLMVDLLKGSFRLAGDGLKRPASMKRIHYPFSDYPILKRYLTINTKIIKQRTKNANNRIPISYAYIPLSVKDPSELNTHLIDRTTAASDPLDNKVMRQITVRRGQSDFRNALLNSYEGHCCITGCKDIALLEAAHIVPHCIEDNMTIHNGLLLRADIHTLYDLNLLQISENGFVSISSSIQSKEYRDLNGLRVLTGIGVNPLDFELNIKRRNQLLL